MDITTKTTTNLLTKKLEIKLKEINILLREKYSYEEHIGVLGGLSGIALFQFYYAKYTNTDQFSDWGQDTLEKIIKKINQGYDFPTFSSGIAGAAWVFDHLKNHEFIELENDNLWGEIDRYLYNVMVGDLNNADYDFLHGAMGYAYYFYMRYNSTLDTILKNRYRNYIFKFLEELDKIAKKDNNGLKWESLINAINNKKVLGYNLSLSHGIASIVTFLSKLYLHKDFKEKSEYLLMGAINFLESSELSSIIKSTSIFPSWVLKNGEKDKDSRLAWCYGDFGIGLALLKTSKVLENNKLKEKALLILESTTKRTNQTNTKVIDAGICHGAFGNAQIYNYLYRETRNEIYRTAATSWIEKGLDMSTYNDGYAGFKQWFGNPDEWIPKTSLLEGVAGIGLSIIDYLSEESNSWDECLLIS